MSPPDPAPKHRVLSLRVRNIMRLTAADVHPPAHAVAVHGKNGAGKSTLLRAIAMAVGGKNADPEEPITKGEESGEISLDIGAYIIRCRYTEAGRYLHLEETATGKKITSPQAVLDTLHAAMCADPLAFSRLSPREQAATLMRIAGIDFADLDRERKKVFEDRTLINRQKEAAEARARSLRREWPEKLPESEIPAAAIMTQKENVAEDIRTLNALEQIVSAQLDKEEELKAQLRAVQERLGEARDKLATFCANYDDSNQQAVRTHLTNTLSELDARVRSADAVNQAVRDRAAHRKAEDEASKLRDQSDAATKKIEEIDEQKRQALAKSPIPVDGLTFDESGVRLNNIPLSQASQAERMRVCILAVLALNPRFRVITVQDASVLDSEQRKAMEQLARELDVQLWLEFADTEEAVAGIEVVDGVARDVA